MRDNAARKGNKGMVRDQSQVQPSKNKSSKAKKGPPPKLPPASKSELVSSVPTADDALQIPLELQQRLLDVFRQSFADTLGTDLTPLLQELKGHLYNRDFVKAFGTEKYLEPYAIRWSPSRALAYLGVFYGLAEDILPRTRRGPTDRKRSPGSKEEGTADASPDESTEDDTPHDRSTTLNVVSLGGGAGAEVVALAGFLHHLRHPPSSASPIPGLVATNLFLSLSIIDIADWSSILTKLSEPIHCPTSTSPLLATKDLTLSFHNHDLLALPLPKLATLLADADLITLMFTLNELYSSSIPATTKLLLALGSVCRPGTVLLVVDSPGSYSTLALAGAAKESETEKEEEKEKETEKEKGEDKEGKRYPMQWLMDHTLLDEGVGRDVKRERERTRGWRWEKVAEEAGRWFRMPQALEYEVPLENVRMQVHCYRLLAVG